ncbi:peroxiredoxin [Tieghemostelium lacteum]|uniref:Peroxiredoxin n=1 Tax=Tieghemostelium lacteum TaxID=361077 RepID=A0A151ZIR0_TIELA|nr:peroxiredoxin [Tieghemostelium lacteum]|eukprot:KYQ93853.1 peroxiredoxin [Tieghemostelium lacteum]
MTIKVGDNLEQFNTTLFYALPEVDGVCQMGKKIQSNDLFKGKKVILFAIPGAFTPTCSAQHVPSYINLAKEIKAKGVDDVYCITTNDPFVLSIFETHSKANGTVKFISDGNSEFTKKLGLDFDGSVFGLGAGRTQRYAMIVDKGIVTAIDIEKPGQYEVSSAEAILKKL